MARARGGTAFRLSPSEFTLVSDLSGPARPVSEVEQKVEAIIGSQAKQPKESQGWLSDPARRKAVELHAMKRAKDYFSVLWKTVTDVSRRTSFDLYCSDEKKELWVEVKGTTSAGASILLTRNEVTKAGILFPRIALFVTHSIELENSDKGKIIATGGTDLVVNPWNINDYDTTPMTYECKIA